MSDTGWTRDAETHTRSVPYEWIAPGDGPGPLIVALHGRGEDESIMRARMAPLARAGWRVLVPQAPYPFDSVGRRRRIGYAWYQFDGDQASFLASMDAAGAFLFPLIDRMRERLGVATRDLALLGFSQGAYLGYYLGLRHPERFRAVVGVAGRAKAESVDVRAAAGRVSILHLHGRDDEAMSPEPCRASIQALRDAGVDATFRLAEGGHDVTPAMVQEAETWLATRPWDRPPTGKE